MNQWVQATSTYCKYYSSVAENSCCIFHVSMISHLLNLSHHQSLSEIEHLFCIIFGLFSFNKSN